MTDSAPAAPTEVHPASALELEVDEAITICDGDVRAALTAALVYKMFLERKLEIMRGMISAGYTRGKITPSHGASQKLDEWRAVFSPSESSGDKT